MAIKNFYGIVSIVDLKGKVNRLSKAERQVE